MANSSILTLRVDSKLKKKLDKLAKTTKRSRSFLAAEAIREYVLRGITPAEELLKRFASEWNGSIAPAFQEYAY